MSVTKKIIIYQKIASSKPIVIHDDSDISSDDLQKKLEECFKSNSIYTFKTTSDTLIIRPSEISSILITNEDQDNPYKAELHNKKDNKRN